MLLLEGFSESLQYGQCLGHMDWKDIIKRLDKMSSGLQNNAMMAEDKMLDNLAEHYYEEKKDGGCDDSRTET